MWKVDYHKKGCPTFLEARRCGQVALLLSSAGTERPTAVSMAGEDAGSATCRQVWWHLFGGQGGRNYQNSSTLIPWPSNVTFQNSHKYLEMFPNIDVYKCSLHCLNNETLETKVYQSGKGLKFIASLNYKTLSSDEKN